MSTPSKTQAALAAPPQPRPVPLSRLMLSRTTVSLARRESPQLCWGGLPRDRDLDDSVLVALDSRNVRHQNRAVLHGVQMTPAPLAAVVTRSFALTLRTKKCRIRSHLHRHHDRLLFIQTECHIRDSPWIFDPQQSRIERSILHRDTVPTRGKLDPTRCHRRLTPLSDPHKTRKSRNSYSPAQEVGGTRSVPGPSVRSSEAAKTPGESSGSSPGAASSS